MLVSFLGLARIVAAAEADESKAADSCNHANLVNRQSMMRHLQSGYRILSSTMSSHYEVRTRGNYDDPNMD
jgi:hypothetical protein